MNDEQRDELLIKLVASTSKMEGHIFNGLSKQVEESHKMLTEMQKPEWMKKHCPFKERIPEKPIVPSSIKRDKIKTALMFGAIAVSGTIGILGLVF